jgi:hypothetical protein
MGRGGGHDACGRPAGATVLTGVWPLGISLAAFVVAAIAIGVAGSRLTRDADDLADVTGLGEAMMGAVFIGADDVAARHRHVHRGGRGRPRGDRGRAASASRAS